MKTPFETISDPDVFPDRYVVETIALTRARIDGSVPRLIRRASLDGKELLHADERVDTAGYLDLETIATLIRSGALSEISKPEILELILRDKAQCGIGITPGGGCAGISDLILSLHSELADRGKRKKLLAVPHAGKGLIQGPDKFESSLIYLEHLLAQDLHGMAETPFGTARLSPLANARGRVKENLNGFGFLYGTGGNGGLAMFRELAKECPEMVVVAAPKTIDGDVAVAGEPAQSLGFSTAVETCRQEIFAIDETNRSMGGVMIAEIFGRDGGGLAFESARTDGETLVGQVLDYRMQKLMRRKAGELMVLAPEKPVSLERLASEVARMKARNGHCTVVAAEGFMPPELKQLILNLSDNENLRQRFVQGRLDANGLNDYLSRSGNSPDYFLTEILKDREQAEFFLNMLYGESGVTISPDRSEVRIPAVRRFLIEAIKLQSGVRPRRSIVSYELRGAFPDRHDSQMGRRLGGKMAELIQDGVKGGKVVYYKLGENPYHVAPSIADLSEVGTGDLMATYSDDVLRSNGVFW